jgi:hypothetical protein
VSGPGASIARTPRWSRPCCPRVTHRRDLPNRFSRGLRTGNNDMRSSRGTRWPNPHPLCPYQRERHAQDPGASEQAAQQDWMPGYLMTRIRSLQAREGAGGQAFRRCHFRLERGSGVQQALHLTPCLRMVDVPIRPHAPHPFGSTSRWSGASRGDSTRSSRLRDSRRRPAFRRLRTVPSGTPSRRATSATEKPSK